jgi:hypothetical protein
VITIPLNYKAISTLSHSRYVTTQDDATIARIGLCYRECDISMNSHIVIHFIYPPKELMVRIKCHQNISYCKSPQAMKGNFN